VKYVLFVCTHNAGRSQMAQAFFERYAPGDVRAESAGQEPADAPWPEVVVAMSEVGLDISNRKPKKLDLEMQLHADWAITLKCGGVCPYVPSMVEEWDVEDPRGKTMNEVRAIRDDIERRVKDLVENKLEAIRTDPTSHNIRLQRLLPQLVEEFEGTREPELIRACADAVLKQHADAPVRSFVLTLAYRQARECLREDECALIDPLGPETALMA
jgi:protein-tyrosine-phosphatase